jgi:hypothetical protein
VARSGVINFGYLEPRSLPIVLTGTVGTNKIQSDGVIALRSPRNFSGLFQGRPLCQTEDAS